MGEKDARYSEEVGLFADELVDTLTPLGELSWRKMFGGAGIFLDGSMFALVDSGARLHLKVADANRARFEEAGSEQHGRMPYFAVPDEVLSDDETLREWAATSVAVARAG